MPVLKYDSVDRIYGHGRAPAVATILAALALLAAACGTRLNENAVRAAHNGSSTVEEQVGGPAGASGPATVSNPSAAGLSGSAAGPAGAATGALPALAAGNRSGITSDTIKIGGIFPLSGGLSALGRPIEEAARAYFRYVNDNGGVDGRKLDFISEDDSADPNRTRSAAEKLVDEDHIFVMGPSFTPFSPDLVSFLQQRGVPFVGYDGVNVEGFASPTTITLGASIAPHARTLIPYWFQRTHAKRIGVVYLDVPPAVSYLNETKNVICPKLGCQVVRAQPVQYTTTDYVSILLAMQSAPVDGIFIVTDPASAVKLLLQAKELNYKPSPGGYLGQHGIYLDLVPQSCGAFCNGILAPTSLFPPSVPNAATTEMRRVVGTYYSDVSYGYFTELGYVSAKVLVDLIHRAGPSTDRAGIIRVARTLTHYDTGGFTNPAKPIDLTPGVEHERDIMIVRMQDGGWAQDSGWLTPENF